VLFPDPAIPVTRTRLPIPKAASLIDVSVPQVPYRAHQPVADPHGRFRRLVHEGVPVWQLLMHVVDHGRSTERKRRRCSPPRGDRQVSSTCSTTPKNRPTASHRRASAPQVRDAAGSV
jgi:hypothetical protein